MIVKLVEHTPNPEEVCAKAMRACRTRDASFEVKLKKPVEYYIKLALKSKHLSVLEHSSFTFSIKGISRVCSHQLVRHRIASYSQQSGRIVDFKEEDWKCPPSVEKSSYFREVAEEMRKVTELYHKMVDGEVPREDARYILPSARKTNITVTMNARELLHFLELRLNPPAQWEIRELARKMFLLARKVAPNIFGEIEKEREASLPKQRDA